MSERRSRGSSSQTPTHSLPHFAQSRSEPCPHPATHPEPLLHFARSDRLSSLCPRTLTPSPSPSSPPRLARTMVPPPSPPPPRAAQTASRSG
eukprot:2949970-Rhodomonas_salina.1